jgi:hypothetical protein
MKTYKGQPSSSVKHAALLLIPLAFAAFSASAATLRFWNGSTSTDWSDGSNFQENGTNDPGVPGVGDDVNINNISFPAPVIDSSGYAALNAIALDADMAVSAGGVLETAFFTIGQNLNGTLDLHDGALNVTNLMNVAGANGKTANLNVYDGTHSINQFFLNQNGDALGGGSFATLLGGTVNATVLSINSAHSAVLNIAGGTMVLADSNLGNVNYWIGSGNIVGYGGAQTVNIENSGGFISLTAIPEPSSFALLGGCTALLLVVARRRR